jgi:type I restriction enzyme M protein
VLAAEFKGKVDRVWDAFWSGGISNPLEVIEQITYLLFIRRLDDLQTAKENRANATGESIEAPIFPDGNAPSGVPYSHLRWKYLKDQAPAVAYDLVANHVFNFLQAMGGQDSTYAGHMKDARLTIPTPGLLVKVMEMLSEVPMNKRDTSGDLYEYMLGKIASAGQNGQFRTPRHIIELMVHLMAPKPTDEICDPACGTAGFLVAASMYVRTEHPELLEDAAQRSDSSMFHGYDFDNTMLRIGSMNMLMHGVERPDIRYRDSLSQSAGEDAEKYSLILANPPFAGSLDYDTVATDLLKTVKTKKTELLFLALFLRLLRTGGRAAVVVPDGVLFGSSAAHKSLRRTLVEEHKLDAVIKLPAGAFKPYAGVSTAILVFTKTGTGGTDNVWFYDIQADGWSLDDKRQPLLPDGQLGVAPREAFVVGNHAKNNLPDLLDRWQQRTTSEKSRARSEQSFLVTKADIVANDYDFTLNRYRGEMGSSELALSNHVTNPLPKSSAEGFLVVGHKCLGDSGFEAGLAADNPLSGKVTPLEPGDILCRTIGEPRFTVVRGSTAAPLAADGTVHVLRLKEARPDIVLAMLRSEYVQQQIEARRYSGAGLPRITYRNLLDVRLPQLPSTSFANVDSSPLVELRSRAQRLAATVETRAYQAFSVLEGDLALLEYIDAVTESAAVGRVIDRMSTPLSVAQLTFPHPVARLLRAYEIARTSGDPRAENEAVLHLFESCLITLGATLAGYLASQSRSLNAGWRNNLKRRAVSLGDWHKLSKASASDIAAGGGSLRGLAEAAQQGTELDTVLEDFISWRNHRSHGSGPRTRSDYLKDNSERRNKVEYLIEELRPLARLQWWAADDLDWDPDGQRYRVRVRDLHGDHPDFPLSETIRTAPVARGQVMVTDGQEEWSLECVLRYMPCGECGDDEFFYPDARSDDGLLYRSLGRGHIAIAALDDIPAYLRSIVDPA